MTVIMEVVSDEAAIDVIRYDNGFGVTRRAVSRFGRSRLAPYESLFTPTKLMFLRFVQKKAHKCLLLQNYAVFAS